MKLIKDVGEFGFINRITPGCLVRKEGVIKAIGDDAAAFYSPPGHLNLVTTDLLVERVHFLREATSGFNLGYKALAVNLSDIAAMGGTAAEAFVSIAIPENCCLDYLDDLYRGMRELASKFQVNILGGDTTASKQDLIINIAVQGYVDEKEILCRDGAVPGDKICCTGDLGDSRAGLHQILNDINADTAEMDKLLRAHLLPSPCLDEGRFLAGISGVTSAIDVSDGLSSDLEHLVFQSGTGARIYANSIPVSPELEVFCKRFDFDPVEFALAGGEDYILLFTATAENMRNLEHEYREKFASGIRVLGEMTDTGEMELVEADGTSRPLARSGWNHFRK